MHIEYIIKQLFSQWHLLFSLIFLCGSFLVLCHCWNLFTSAALPRDTGTLRKAAKLEGEKKDELDTSEMKFALFIHCKCWLFVRKDSELMKKSQEAKEDGKIIPQGYMVIITKDQANHSGEDRGDRRKRLKVRGGTTCDCQRTTGNQDRNLSEEFVSYCNDFRVNSRPACFKFPAQDDSCAWL